MLVAAQIDLICTARSAVAARWDLRHIGGSRSALGCYLLLPLALGALRLSA